MQRCHDACRRRPALADETSDSRAVFACCGAAANKVAHAAEELYHPSDDAAPAPTLQTTPFARDGELVPVVLNQQARAKNGAKTSVVLSVRVELSSSSSAAAKEGASKVLLSALLAC